VISLRLSGVKKTEFINDPGRSKATTLSSLAAVWALMAMLAAAVGAGKTGAGTSVGAERGGVDGMGVVSGTAGAVESGGSLIARGWHAAVTVIKRMLMTSFLIMVLILYCWRIFANETHAG